MVRGDHHHYSIASRSGVDDSLRSAKTYIQHEAGNRFDEARVNTFLDNARAGVTSDITAGRVLRKTTRRISDYSIDTPALKIGRPLS